MKIDYEKFAETKEAISIDSEFTLYFDRGVEVYDPQKNDWIKVPAIKVWNEIDRHPIISLPIWFANKQNIIEVTKKAIKMFKQYSVYYEDLD